MEAYCNPEHPCHMFPTLQHGVADENWQLPEPFNGASATAGIVFVGLNPSYNPCERVPRIGASFEEWDSFYRYRFDSDPAQWARLYRRYQQLGQIAVGPAFRLGRDALVLEVVRFRSEKGEGVKGVKAAAVLAHARELTVQLLRDVGPA